MSGRRLKLWAALLASIAASPAAVGGAADSARLDEVAKLGAGVMPFDLDKTTHVFDKTAHGGIQQVVAKNGEDAEQIFLIRKHLAEIAGKFAHGDFSAPARIHGADMPGLAELKQAPQGSLKVKYSVLARGAQIEYSADDPALVCAIHRWFDAQLSDHARHATEGHCKHAAPLH